MAVGTDPLSCAGQDLAAVGLGLLDDAGDLPVLEIEHVVQQEHGAFHGRQALEENQEGEGERFGEFGGGGGIGRGIGRDGFRQPRSHVGLPASAR